MNQKIIRRPDFAGGGITAEEKALMDEHTTQWISRAYQTGRVNRDKLIPAIAGIYAAAGLKRPRIVIVPSPRVMAFAGGFAAAIWWLRKNGGSASIDVDAATRAATYDATDDATSAATYDATYDATRAATYDATSAATYDATYDATSAATDDATDAATRAATSAATRAATYDATYDATSAANQFVQLARELVGPQHIDFALRCAQMWYRMYQGGNMWAAWDCYLTAARDILRLKLAAHEKYAAWEQAAIHGGFRIMHEEFCMICEFPDVIRVDEQNRAHSHEGPSHRWMDGWSLYHSHGMRIPDWIIEHPEQITVQKIEAESNAEIRRVMMERYGYQRYMQDCGAQVVDQVGDNHELVGLRTAQLLRKDLPGEPEPIVYISMLNSSPEPDGTFKRYLERVDPKAYGGAAAKSCHAAMASRWRYRDESGELQLTFRDYRDYRPSIET